MCSYFYQRNPSRTSVLVNDQPTKPENGVLALTCDTLLSSQGAGAHLCEAFDLVLGQRSKLTDSVWTSQTDSIGVSCLDCFCSLPQDRPCLAHSHEDSVLANRRAAWCPLLPCDDVTICRRVRTGQIRSPTGIRARRTSLTEPRKAHCGGAKPLQMNNNCAFGGRSAAG